MRKPLGRILAIAIFALTLGSARADAGPINVAEFRWDAIEIDTDIVLSLFSLTNIWDGDEPAPTIFGNQLTLPSGTQFWSDLAPPLLAGGVNFEQIFDIGLLPQLAQVSISFLLGTEIITLTGSLAEANTAILLQYNAPDPTPVPEPSTLTLLGLGALAMGRAAIRGRRQRR
jgi:PEP-CTERM motif-containing protein